jgi:hypothetical protein
MGYFVDAQVILLVRHRVYKWLHEKLIFPKFLEIRSRTDFSVPERIKSFRNV